MPNKSRKSSWRDLVFSQENKPKPANAHHPDGSTQAGIFTEALISLA
jgi:hypothetical protein